jgi:ferritin-like protein
MSSETLHEDAEKLGPKVIDRHRAIVSLMEELEAVDWYDQRVAATEDDELRAVLAHNRDEEKEHASMVLEWLRRQDPALDRNLRKYLFTEEPFSALIAAEKVEPPSPVAPDGHLGIGDLRAANER